MNTETQSETVTVFPRMVAVAVSRLKTQLREDYEARYPDLGEIIRLVLDEEEARAWDLSAFPHLILPDLVDEHIAQLGLPPADTRHDVVMTGTPDPELVFAATG